MKFPGRKKNTRTACYWYTKYPPGSLSASTVGGRRVCSQLPSHSVCGHSTIVAWCVRVIQQSSSSSLQTTIVGPTKVAWCVPSLKRREKSFHTCDNRDTCSAPFVWDRPSGERSRTPTQARVSRNGRLGSKSIPDPLFPTGGDGHAHFRLIGFMAFPISRLFFSALVVL